MLLAEELALVALKPVGRIVRRLIQEAAEVAGSTAAIGGATAASS